MTKSILYECFNLALPKGTGIKTYALTLAQTAQSLGYRPEALLQTTSRLTKKDPLLAEISFYEGVERSSWQDKYLRRPFESLVGKPFGIPTRPLPDSGFVLSPGQNSTAKLFEQQHVAYQMMATARRHFWCTGQLANLNLDQAPDLFHATHMIPVRTRKSPNVYTIHDVIPLRLPRATLDNKKYFLKSLRAICAQADHIVTVSECSKKDILSVVSMPEDRISVTYQSVTFPKMDAESDALGQLLLQHVYSLEPKNYFLYFGALEPKKNVSRLIDAYVAAGSSAPLIIAGGLGWSYDAEVEQINQEHFSSWRIAQDQIRLERKIRRLDHLPRSHLTALIRNARAVLFPSLYEGFGLPVLEAMMLGAPVMTSNVSSLPEVAGEAALQINPYDMEGMTQAIRDLDHDGDLREALTQKGYRQAQKFSSEVYAQRISDLYSKLL